MKTPLGWRSKEGQGKESVFAVHSIFSRARVCAHWRRGKHQSALQDSDPDFFGGRDGGETHKPGRPAKVGRLALGSVIHGALGPGAPFPVPGTARASPWLPGWQVPFPPWHLSSQVTTLRRNPAPPCTKLKRKAPTVRTCFLQDTKGDSLGFLCAQSKAGSLGHLGAQSMWEARAGGGLGGAPQ